MCDIQDVCEFKGGNALKAFFKMRLHPRWIFGLRQDFQQFVVGQEEKTWEIETLPLQIFIETLKAMIQQLFVVITGIN